MPLFKTSTSTPMPETKAIDEMDQTCSAPGFYDEILTSSLCSAILILAIYYITHGYKYFKLSMFLMGFTFVACVVYMMCIQDAIMPEYGKVLTSIGGGLTLGFMTCLSQYLGLFVTGFEGGVDLGISSLAIYNNIFSTRVPITNWEVVGVLFIFGVVFACINLHYKKGLTIFNTSFVGGSMISLALDFFIHRWATLKWLGARIKLETVVAPPCSYSWLILAMWPIGTIVGIIIQWALTGTGIRHQQSLAAQKRQRAPPLHRTPQQRAEMRQKKYRYLFQIRTAHGDVISQSYVQALQQKHTNLDPWQAGAECSTLQSDSTHLTVLAADPAHPDSDEDSPTQGPYRACQ